MYVCMYVCTSSWIDSCVPIHYKKQNKMAYFFFLSVKGIAVPNVLILAENKMWPN